MLRREDIEKRITGAGVEYYTKDRGKLIVSVPHGYCERDLVAATHNAAIVDGTDYGRAILHEELRELLGIK